MYSLTIVEIIKIVLLLIIINLLAQSKAQNETLLSVKSQQEISPRFLTNSMFNLRPSIFNIVQFPNDECHDATNQTGTCYTAFECKKLGGLPSSPCAKGLGSCCIVSRTCHNSTSHRIVYFKNQNYPMFDSSQNFCDLTVDIIDQDICQLRLDFLDFQLDQPEGGLCKGDRLTISASGFAPTSIPILCGYNKNQHIYVSLPREMKNRSASIVFITNSVGDYRWNMRITQIDCNRYGKRNLIDRRLGRGFATGYSTKLTTYKPSLFDKVDFRSSYSMPAPHGCLQYFTAPIGFIESFNFGEYLLNMDYAICIERQPTTCRVIFSATNNNFGIFRMTSKLLAGVGDVSCATDYLSIPGGSRTGDTTATETTHDRYCGRYLNYMETTNSAPIISKANGPIILRFHTGNQQDPIIKEGFRLRYEQSSTNCVPIFQDTLESSFSYPYQQTPLLANLIQMNIEGKNSQAPISQTGSLKQELHGRSSNRSNNKLLNF